MRYREAMGALTQMPGGSDLAPAWPDLTLAGWTDTRDTLHMWTQIVGKVRLALEPMVNHWWQVPLYVSARGLTTSLIHARGADLEMEFDLIDHVLDIRTSAGQLRQVALEARSVADFYAATMSALSTLGVEVKILARPVEVPNAIPFAEDELHGAYDALAAHRFGVALRHAHRVLSRFRAGFQGKVRPRALLLGWLRPGRHPVLGPDRSPASRGRTELCGLGDAAGVQPRSEQLRVLAWR
jgi:hypothetical protein